MGQDGSQLRILQKPYVIRTVSTSYVNPISAFPPMMYWKTCRSICIGTNEISICTFLPAMQLTQFDKGRCIAYLDCGKSIRWTALKIVVSKTTVALWWNRYRREGNVERTLQHLFSIPYSSITLNFCLGQLVALTCPPLSMCGIRLAEKCMRVT